MSTPGGNPDAPPGSGKRKRPKGKAKKAAQEAGVAAGQESQQVNPASTAGAQPQG